MKERRKLSYYANSIIGFAYERINFRNLNTYLVIKVNQERMGFVFYKKYKDLCDKNMIDIINILESQGYKTLDYYVKEKEEKKLTKKI